MITAFRKVRQRLLQENRFTKYLIYASGEIILVVVGILIALSINNWNEQRKLHNLEQDYLIALKKEFQNNVEEVDRVIDLNASLLASAVELATYTGPELPDITEKRFAKLLLGTINSEVQYRPGSGVLNEVISSGKLNLFRNMELKNALAILDGILLNIRFQEDEELKPMRNELLFLAQERTSMRKLAYDAYGSNFGLDEGRFKKSHLDLLTYMPFDNRLTGFIYTAGYLEGRYERLKEHMQLIITIIDTQIEE